MNRNPLNPFVMSLSSDSQIERDPRIFGPVERFSIRQSV
jgi:hypothetical protein